MSIPNIGAHRLGSEFNVLLTAGGSKTAVKVSAMSYVTSVLGKSKDQNQINLAVALYQYYAAAKAYKA